MAIQWSSFLLSTDKYAEFTKLHDRLVPGCPQTVHQYVLLQQMCKQLNVKKVSNPAQMYPSDSFMWTQQVSVQLWQASGPPRCEEQSLTACTDPTTATLPYLRANAGMKGEGKVPVLC
jgi:hypothetical protein